MKWSDIKDKPREIDRLIAEKVMGKTVCENQDDSDYCFEICSKEQEDPYSCHGARKYSTDIAAAWEVVEKLKKEGFVINIGNGQEWYCLILGDGEESSSDDSSILYAICHAALLLKEVIDA